jgi:hypothetical protein
MTVPSGTDIRSRGALRGDEGSVETERPRSGPPFAISWGGVSKEVGVTGAVMV